MSSMAMSPIYVIDNPPKTIYATCYTNFAKASWFKKNTCIIIFTWFQNIASQSDGVSFHHSVDVLLNESRSWRI